MIHGVLNLGRGMTEDRFTETLEAFTETKVLDEDPESPTAGEYVTTENVVYTDMPGRVKFPTLTVREREQGAQVPAIQDVAVHVAVGSAPLVVVNTLWRVTASTADPALVGRVFRTKGLPQAGQVTASRFPVEQVS